MSKTHSKSNGRVQQMKQVLTPEQLNMMRRRSRQIMTLAFQLLEDVEEALDVPQNKRTRLN